MDISHFFERPVLFNTTEWAEGTNFFNSYNPWLYFLLPFIQQKLAGYARLTADLEVEVRLNGSPFRFSQLLASYRPLFYRNKAGQASASDPLEFNSLAEFSGGYLPEDGCNVGTFLSVTPSGSSDFTIMARSQRQHAYLDVASSQGCHMRFPFLHPFGALRVGPAAGETMSLLDSELCAMGTFTLESLATLRNTQPASGIGVTVDVYVRAVNVRVWLASGSSAPEFVPQGSERKPSEVASSVAKTMSFFSRAPVIGHYATLSSYLASGVSSILQFFGYTPRPDTSLPQYVTGYSFPVESSVTCPKKVRNLGLDHNNNVVIDPAVIGPSSVDELALSVFCAKPTLLARTYFWSSLQPMDPIFLLPVSPFHYISELQTNSARPDMRRFQMTPCSLAAMNFRYWRGTMCVRFDVIKTQFHRGRLRLTWEPEIGGSTTREVANLYTTKEGYQQMVNWDITANNSLTVKVGFGARKGRLTIPRFGAPALSDKTFITNTEATSGGIAGGTLVVDNYEDYFNGFLRMSILTRLQSPDESFPLPIMVHVWYEDMEFYDPLENGPSLTTVQQWPPYSSTSLPTSSSSYYGTVYDGEDVENLMTRPLVPEGFFPQGQEVDTTHVFQPSTVVEEAVHEGEKVGSLRSLIQRDVLYDTLCFEVPTVVTQPSVSSSGATVSSYVPPVVFDCMIPSYPFSYGTVGPLRNTTFTTTTSNPSYAYTGTDGISRTYYPSHARTNLFCLLRECFVGFRGSYNWKFTPVIESGTSVKIMAASRSNFTTARTPITGSLPRNERVDSIASFPSDLAGPQFAYARSSNLTVLNYDTGPTVASTTITTRTSINSGVKLSAIRRFLNSVLGSFASGSLVVHTDEQKTLGVRQPYFSNTRFLPGSSTGWMCANSNAELSQYIRFSCVTDSKYSGTFNTTWTQVPSTTAAGYERWTLVRNAPVRNQICVSMICSAGDDISFGHFVSVPTLYATSASVFTDTAQTDS